MPPSGASIDSPIPPPHISPALLAYLQTHFPNRCARPGMTPEMVWLEAGARSVVNHLESLAADQHASYLGSLSE